MSWWWLYISNCNVPSRPTEVIGVWSKGGLDWCFQYCRLCQRQLSNSSLRPDMVIKVSPATLQLTSGDTLLNLHCAKMEQDLHPCCSHSVTPVPYVHNVWTARPVHMPHEACPNKVFQSRIHWSRQLNFTMHGIVDVNTAFACDVQHTNLQWIVGASRDKTCDVSTVSAWYRDSLYGLWLKSKSCWHCIKRILHAITSRVSVRSVHKCTLQNGAILDL